MFRRSRQSKPSIYEHIRAHMPAEGTGLREDGETLPDEDSLDDGVRWAPGAQDGVLTHHWGGSAEPAELDRLYDAIATAVEDRRAFAGLREAAREVTVISLVDELLTRLRSSDLDPERIYRLGHRLAVESHDRQPVKLGISMLGLFSAHHHRDELMTLGRHEEFTLFVALALANRDGDAEPDLWELARQVTGWGRIHLVERLAGTPKPELRDWILREGFRNAVMDEYLAGLAAESGDLAGKLARDPDDELLHAAGDILTALCAEGGPAGGMADLPDGERATRLFIGHMTTRASDLRHFLAVHAIQRYAEQQWPAMAEQCAEIVAWPIWPELARQGLTAEDDEAFDRADRACGALGIPTSPVHQRRLRADPYDLFGWFAVMNQANADTIDEAVGLAAELLPLADIATGPAEEDGHGLRFAPHRCLDALLPALSEWPGRGWPLIAAGLASPLIRNRNQAVRALEAWDRTSWPPAAQPALREALVHEPVSDVREAMQRVLEG
jgi:hypothetical protein